MHGSLEQPPIVIRGSRARALVLTLICAGFVAIGAAYVSGPKGSDPAMGFVMVFFGLGLPVALWMLVAPSRLEIGPTGIAESVLWRTTRMSWDEVYNFRPVAMGLSNRFIGFDYLVPPRKGGGLRRLNAALVGAQGALQAGWEIDSQAVANLLNQARERWLHAPAAGLAPAAAPITPSPVQGAVRGGRMNRKVFWIATAVLIALGAGLSFIPGISKGGGYAIGVAMIWLITARLHDIGRSGWWQAGLYAVQIALVATGAVAGDEAMSLMTFAGLASQLIFTVVLGAIPGQAGPNRFGPAPGQPTPLASSEAFR